MLAPEDYRFTKIDDAIQRLASVANDLSKILAVHEQRIIQQEKNSDNIIDVLEKRREELEEKLKGVYVTIKEELKPIKEKISFVEKMVWVATGAGGVIGYLISLIFNYYNKH
jgi:preprotein translocase subunit Sss1